MRTNFLSYLYDTAARVPDKPAFSDGRETLTFSSLLKQTESVAAFLRANGFSSGPVGVLTERTPSAVAVMLGVIRAGCFYVPLDKEMGRERLDGIRARTALTAVLADAENGAGCPGLLPGVRVLPAGEALRFSGGVPPLAGADTDPTYTVFTSGSTGMPKGVTGCHRAVIDYAENMLPAVGLSGGDIMGCQSPFYFDAWYKELLNCIVNGATVYLIPRALFARPAELVAFLNRYGINTVCWVSSALALVAALKTFKTVKPQYLRKVCFGSEMLLPKHLRYWMEGCPEARFVNLYGPTECTGMSCCYPLPGPVADGSPIPIGRPFPNTKLLLVDEAGREADEGEIYIGGSCVTLGYYNDPERTAAAFVQNPLQSAYRDIFYRTGDLARYDEAGELVFLGRADQQIKRMGHRIELGEIESAAGAAGAESAVCLYEPRAQTLLLLYTGSVTEQALSALLQEKLPAFARPNRLLRLQEMPVTPNGKTDRKKLKEQYLR